MKKRAHIIVHGRVQGVFFRHHTTEKARELKVTGWVKNLSDGTVEIICEGEKNDIDEMILWCGKGPRGAFVEKTDVSWEEYAGEFATFDTRY